MTYDNGDSDLFDTVVVAVGRYADTRGLGLEAVGVKTDPASGKVSGADSGSGLSGGDSGWLLSGRDRGRVLSGGDSGW